MSIELVLYFFFRKHSAGEKFYACLVRKTLCVYRTCSVFFLIAEENSVRDLAGTLYDQMTQMTINGGFEKVIK